MFVGFLFILRNQGVVQVNRVVQVDRVVLGVQSVQVNRVVLVVLVNLGVLMVQLALAHRVVRLFLKSLARSESFMLHSLCIFLFLLTFNCSSDFFLYQEMNELYSMTSSFYERLRIVSMKDC